MDQRLYDVIYSGEVLAGFDPEQVRRGVADLFKTDDAGVARLFSGQPVIIKKGVDEATAFRYREAMHKTGALCQIRPAARPSSDPRAAGALASAAILPAGTLLPQPPPIKPPEFDLAGLSVAPPGIQLVEPAHIDAVPMPDISGLSMAAAGVVLVEPTVSEPASLPDTSRISMAPIGAEMLNPAEKPPTPPPPNPGKFSLEP